MIDEDFLIKDEKEAIDGYEKYLAQGVRCSKIISIVNKIILDEERHIKLLKKIKKLK